MGFRDCISEVSQYMLETEGFNVQNPFRMRLLSHLKCFAEQRTIETRTAATLITQLEMNPYSLQFDSQASKNCFNF